MGGAGVLSLDEVLQPVMPQARMPIARMPAWVDARSRGDGGRIVEFRMLTVVHRRDRSLHGGPDGAQRLN
jgi:hypothetical protein